VRPLRTVARGMLGAIFVASGAQALSNPDFHVPQAKRVTDRIVPALEKTNPRLASDTRTLVRINGAVQLAGGLLLTTRWAHRPAAVVLAASLVPTTVAGHPFWLDDGDAAHRRGQQVHFLKNLGLFGGLLLAATDTEGRPGLRWRTAHLVHHSQRSMRRARQMARRQAKLARRTALAGGLAGRRLSR
jgi:putative oxidoreductase